MGRSYNDVVKIGEIAKDEIMSERVISFCTLKETTQGIQNWAKILSSRRNMM